jgi:hypothetical protein
MQHVGTAFVAVPRSSPACSTVAHAKTDSSLEAQGGPMAVVPWALLAAGIATGASRAMPPSATGAASVASAMLQPMLYATTLLYLGWVT